MAADPLQAYLKKGFPIYTDTSGEFLTTLEYVGPKAAILAPGITNGMQWGLFPGIVSYFDYEPLENEEYSSLKITCSYKYQPGESSGKTETIETSVRVEVEWVDIMRPLAEHPYFQGELEIRDMIDVDRWKQETDPELRAAYKYKPEDGADVTLSVKAQKLALGHAQGIESYTDHAPVVRLNTTYLNGYPASSGAGMKEAPAVPGGTPGPTGYEWIKTADRCVQVGEKNRWDRVEEWTGAIKVLVDKDSIYF